MFFETCLTVLNVAGKATRLYDWFTGTSSGARLSKILEELEKTKADVQRLSERLLYAPNLYQAINIGNSKKLADISQVNAMLDPVARAMNTELLASAVISSPDRLREAFQKDPWEVLIDVRPALRAKRPSNPDLMPIIFTDAGQPYVGWQTRGALPTLFNCDMKFDGDLWLPVGASPKVEFPKKIEPASHPSTELTEEALMAILEPWSSKADFYVKPNIPIRKLKNALFSNGVHPAENILALIDLTTFGSASDSVLFGTKGIYINNGRNSGWEKPEKPIYIDYADFLHRNFINSLYRVTLDRGQFINMLTCEFKSKEMVTILTEIAKLVRDKHQALR